MALAISALRTPAKLDVGTTTPSLCRRTDDKNIKHHIHRYSRNAVLGAQRRILFENLSGTLGMVCVQTDVTVWIKSELLQQLFPVRTRQQSQMEETK